MLARTPRPESNGRPSRAGGGVLGSILAGFLALASTAAALAGEFSLRGTAWERVADRHGLTADLLYAVALAETGRRAHGVLTPHPWTTNGPEGARWFATRAEAEAYIRGHDRIERLDIGLMQVNVRWHGHRVDDPVELLDPLTSIEVGAAIMAETLASSGDPLVGIGRYHSWRRSLGRPYAERVQRYQAVVRRLSGGGPQVVAGMYDSRSAGEAR